MRTLLQPSRAGAVGAFLMLLAAGCAAQPQSAEGAATDRSETMPTSDSARVARLEREARALVKTTGCSSPSECRIAPVGRRSCGGPRTYIAYCAATTDSVALFRKLKELEAAEIAYNSKSGMMSTCEMRMAPSVTTQAGSCRETR